MVSSEAVANLGTRTFTTVNGVDYYVFDGTTSSIITGDGNDYTLTNNTGASAIMHAYNKDTLVANKQYSPLYSTTFDLMSDAQIKAQMDLWVSNGTLPNDIMSVDFNKRLTSVGKNLIKGFNEWTELRPDVAGRVDNGFAWTVTAGFDIAEYLYNISGGKQVTLSMNIAGVSTTLLIQNQDNLTIGTISGSSGRASLTFAPTSDVTKIKIRNTGTVSGTKIITDVQLEVGSTATTYEIIENQVCIS